MKNILFGLMAITSVAFAGLPNLGADVSTAPSGAVFQTGQSGEITVTGKLKKNPEVIKYVVYASTDGSYTGAADQEVYTLPDYVIAGATSAGTTGFGFGGKTIPKLYVKKVNGTNTGVEDLQSGEIVSFKLNIDPAWITGNVNNPLYTGFVSTSSSVNPTVFTLMNKAELEALITNINAGISITSDNSSCRVSLSYNSNIYNPGFIYFRVYGNGTAGFEMDDTPLSANGSFVYLNAIETAFATPKVSYADFSVSVKVN